MVISRVLQETASTFFSNQKMSSVTEKKKSFKIKFLIKAKQINSQSLNFNLKLNFNLDCSLHFTLCRSVKLANVEGEIIV